MTTMTRQRLGYLEALAAHGGAIEDEGGLATTKLREAVPPEERQSADTAKKTLKSMEEAGLIVRDVSGRRVRSISLTEEGWRAFREAAAQAGTEHFVAMTAGMAGQPRPGPNATAPGLEDVEVHGALLAAMVQSLAVTRAVLAEWRSNHRLPDRPYLEACLVAYSGTCRALIETLGKRPEDYPEVPTFTLEDIFEAAGRRVPPPYTS